MKFPTRLEISMKNILDLYWEHSQELFWSTCRENFLGQVKKRSCCLNTLKRTCYWTRCFQKAWSMHRILAKSPAHGPESFQTNLVHVPGQSKFPPVPSTFWMVQTLVLLVRSTCCLSFFVFCVRVFVFAAFVSLCLFVSRFVICFLLCVF